MTTKNIRSRCFTCEKDKITYQCDGCEQRFCFDHLTVHRQELDKQLEEIENQRNIYRQTILEQTNESQKHLLIEKVNQWENDSIEKIREAAREARASILKYSNNYIEPIQIQLNTLTDQIKQMRNENEFNEFNLNHLKEKLNELEQCISRRTNPIIKYHRSFIQKLSVTIPSHNLLVSTSPIGGTWQLDGSTIVGGKQRGNGLNQLCYPVHIFIDNEQSIYIADQCNHRIVKWKQNAKNLEVVAGGNGHGSRNDQLYCPTNVIVDENNDCLIISDAGNRRVVRWPCRNNSSGETIISDVWCMGLALDQQGYLYVSDFGKHEVRRWKIGDVNSLLVAGGNGKGNRLNQLDGPSYIFLDQNRSIYVSDSENNRVVKWVKNANEGIVIAGANKQDTSTQLASPQAIFVDQFETVYVADCGNNRILRWLKGATQGDILLGQNEKGEQTNQFNSPKGIAFDQNNSLYVADWNNHRIQKFNFIPSN